MRALLLLPALLTLTIAAQARADVISDDESECRGKAENAACSVDGKDGTCVTSSCSRLDYSNGTPPSSKTVDCLLCVPGSADAKAEPEATPAKAEPEATPAKAPADKPAADKATAPKPVAEKKSGCSAGAPVSVGTVALGVLILVGLGRGRRRR